MHAIILNSHSRSSFPTNLAYSRAWPSLQGAQFWLCSTQKKLVDSMELKDRVVVVTGAGRGIGAAMCRSFARAEARLVVVSDRDEAAARHVAEQIGAQAIFNRCDVAC